MMAAVTTTTTSPSHNKRPHSSLLAPVFLDPACHSYTGFLPNLENDDRNNDGIDSDAVPVTQLDRVDPQTMSPHEFFDLYITQRKPCILTSNSTASSPSPLLETLAKCAGRIRVQVERRPHPQANFGQNRTSANRSMQEEEGEGGEEVEPLQVIMTVKELIDLKNTDKAALYYLSTQQDDSTSTALFSSLLMASSSSSSSSNKNDNINSLLSTITRCSLLAGNLILESRHLWLGFGNPTNCSCARSDDDSNNLTQKQCCSTTMRPSSSSCSGLHHDFHDNFNLLLAGSKRWILYPPTEYPRIPLFGTVQGLHGINGLICYRGSTTRADGVPLALLLQDDDDDDDGDEEEESDVDLFGKISGFASNSNDQEDEDRVKWDGSDDYQVPPEHNGGSSTTKESEDQEEEGSARSEEKQKNDRYENSHRYFSTILNPDRRPNSFSPVDLTLSKADIARRYPDFCPRGKIEVTIHAGESLYLPASWFHCVSSIPDLVASYHLAANYWYHPPDNNDYERPYRDDFWEKCKAAATENSQ